MSLLKFRTGGESDKRSAITVKSQGKNIPACLGFLPSGPPPHCTGCLWYLQCVCLTLFWAVCHIFYIFLHPVFAQLDWLNFIVITCTSRGDRKHLASDRKCSSRWLVTSFFHIIPVRFFLYPYEFSCLVCWHLCFSVLDHGSIFKTKSVCSKYIRSSHTRIWLNSQIVPIVKLHERAKILGNDVAENMLRERCRWEINSGGGEQDRPRRQGRFVGGGVLKWAHPGCSCSAGNHRACGSQSIAISAQSSFPAPRGGVQR